jgi:hypothetical protein
MRILNSRGGRLETATFPSSSGRSIVHDSIVSEMGERCTVCTKIFQRKGKSTTIKNNTESLEIGFFEHLPDTPEVSQMVEKSEKQMRSGMRCIKNQSIRENNRRNVLMGGNNVPVEDGRNIRSDINIESEQTISNLWR